MRDTWETSVNTCGPRHPEWETSVGDKWKTSVNSCGPRHPSMRDKWKTSVKSLGPRHPEWETSVGDKWKTSVPKAPRVRDKCGRQVEDKTCVGDKWETSGRQVQTHAAQGTQSGRQVWETSVGDKCGRQVWRQVWETSVGDKWETSVKSCSPRAPKCEGQVGHKCKIMQPKTPRAGDKCGRQV